MDWAAGIPWPNFFCENLAQLFSFDENSAKFVEAYTYI